MNQDILYKSLFFGASYALIFFLVYRVGRKSSPALARRVAISSWVFLMGTMWLLGGSASSLLFIPLVISTLFVFRKKVDSGLQQFFQDNHIYKATTIPEQISKLLGNHFYSCAESTMTTRSGDKVQFNWWQGMTSSTVQTGNSRTTTFSHYVVISFAPNVVSDEFKQIARAKADLSSLTFRQKFRRFFILDTERPCRIDDAPDGSFLIMWQTYQTAQQYAYYLNWLKENLSVKAKTVVKPVDKPANTTIPIKAIPQLGRQALNKPMLEHASKTVSNSRF
ncbi:hypothetical protein [Spirosoma gilvum]